MVGWAAASVETRLGVCMEIVDHLYERVFDTAQAVMHTAGQSSLMSYAGSGTNALDRGVEALAYAQMAMNNITPSARWERQFGSTLIPLQKTYRLVSRGVAVVFSCATFPTWNAYPAMLANINPTELLRGMTTLTAFGSPGGTVMSVQFARSGDHCTIWVVLVLESVLRV